MNLLSQEFRTVRLPRRTEVRPKETADIIANAVGSCSIGKVYVLMKSGQLVHRSVPPRNGKERGVRLITVASIEEYLKAVV
jgi:hypothetical protein